MVVFGASCDSQGPAEVAPVATEPLVQSLQTPFELIESGRPDVARVRIRRIAEQAGWTAQSAFLMGLSHHGEKRYTKALTWFDHAARLEPPYPPSAHFRGWALFWLGRPTEAREAFQLHLGMTPDEGDSFFALGLIDLEAAQWDAAEANLLSAIRLQRARPDRAIGVAKAKARLAEVKAQRDGDLAGANALLLEALQLAPDLYEARFRHARLLRQLGFDDRADAQYARAVEARDGKDDAS
jgi:tetratricopeptide (TPR) repeat protein